MEFIMMYCFYLKQQEIEKVKKLVTNLHNKTEYVIRTKNLKQALNHGAGLKKVHRVIKFDRNTWLKPYIDMNSKLKKAKNIFAGDFLKLMSNAAFGKTLENVRKHRNIKLKTIERRRNYSLSQPNYHTTKFFTENLLAIEMRKSQILVNKSVYL